MCYRGEGPEGESTGEGGSCSSLKGNNLAKFANNLLSWETVLDNGAKSKKIANSPFQIAHGLVFIKILS